MILQGIRNGYTSANGKCKDYEMPAERRLTTAEIRRKTNKPIMEKKRRERINKCLEELKSIVLRAVNEESRPNKLEKADILEMTVRYLKTISQPVHLKSEKDNILGDTTQSDYQPMGKHDYSKTSGYENAELMRSARHFENRNTLRYSPYLRPHFSASERVLRHHVSPSFDLHHGYLLSAERQCFYFGHQSRYPPISMSPISSASSQSPAPMSPTEEAKSHEHSTLIEGRNGEEYSPSTAHPLDQKNNCLSPCLSNDFVVGFPADSLNESVKTNGSIWRPWGVTS